METFTELPKEEQDYKLVRYLGLSFIREMFCMDGPVLSLDETVRRIAAVTGHSHEMVRKDKLFEFTALHRFDLEDSEYVLETIYENNTRKFRLVLDY